MRSNCKNGPAEFLSNGKAGLLFESNEKDKLFHSLVQFNELNKKEVFDKKKEQYEEVIHCDTFLMKEAEGSLHQ